MTRLTGLAESSINKSGNVRSRWKTATGQTETAQQTAFATRRTCLAAMVSMAFGVIGGGDGTEPVVSYQNITGEYAGSIDAWSPGRLSEVTGTLSLWLTQDAGAFSGTYAVAGTRTFFDSPYPVPITFAGVVTDGHVEAGVNPSFTFKLKVPNCTDRAYSSRGSFTSDSHVLTVAATIPEPTAFECQGIETVADIVILVQ